MDRAKDLIIRGGMNIAPAELEALIAGHPDVADVAVVGYPDEVLGERVCAVVVPKPARERHPAGGHRPPDRAADRLVQAARAAGGAQALPRNPVGKILKRELRDDIVK